MVLRERIARKFVDRALHTLSASISISTGNESANKGFSIVIFMKNLKFLTIEIGVRLSAL
jgi:hypothetical protein